MTFPPTIGTFEEIESYRRSEREDGRGLFYFSE